jgi:hypothetical protein
LAHHDVCTNHFEIFRAHNVPTDVRESREIDSTNHFEIFRAHNVPTAVRESREIDIKT